MHVSVVIPTRNRPDLIGNSVASVLANTYPSFDITVVDQSDDTQTAEIVQKLAVGCPALRYVHLSRPGLSRAYNVGINSSAGELVAFTDDDCVAPPDWIATVVTAFGNEPAADMLYGQVLLPAALAGVDGIVPTLPIPHRRLLSQRDGFQIYGMGANFAARRRLFDRIGGFDEVLGGGGPLRSSQDFDFQYRVYRSGGTILLCPDVQIEHYGLRTSEQWPATLKAYGVGDGAFYSKHVRCGDLYALWLLLRQVGRLAVREALHAAGLRRRNSKVDYLRSCLLGIWEGFRFPVDSRTRLYRLPA